MLPWVHAGRRAQVDWRSIQPNALVNYRMSPPIRVHESRKDVDGRSMRSGGDVNGTAELSIHQCPDARMATRHGSDVTSCTRLSLRRHEALQLLDPVLYDDETRGRGGLVRAAALLDHEEPLAVG